jgi:hypothetical protein
VVGIGSPPVPFKGPLDHQLYYATILINSRTLQALLYYYSNGETKQGFRVYFIMEDHAETYTSESIGITVQGTPMLATDKLGNALLRRDIVQNDPPFYTPRKDPIKEILAAM